MRGCDVKAKYFISAIPADMSHYAEEASTRASYIACIRGRVQRVGYRRWLRDTAVSHKVNGWVRNLPDGSVAAVLSGTSTAVDALLNECRKGPVGSLVESVVAEPYVGTVEGGFQILAKAPPPVDLGGRHQPVCMEIRLPKLLGKEKNGALEQSLLQQVRGGQLFKQAARRWEAMRTAARNDGVVLLPASARDTYRSLSVQNLVFRELFVPSQEGQFSPVFWRDQYWLPKSRTQFVELPGASNHGWGLSVNVWQSENASVRDWLYENATRFGFCWENPQATWHLTYFVGDSPSQLWNKRSIESAIPGRWLSRPGHQFLARGIVLKPDLFRAGKALILARADDVSSMGKKLESLPEIPEAIISPHQESELRKLSAYGSVPIYQVDPDVNILRQLALYARTQIIGRVIGVTGTSGKTSTCAMLFSSISSLGLRVRKPNKYGNVSSGISRALRTEPWDADVYIFEMAGGTMPLNAQLVRPDVAVITNIGPGHLERDGSLRAIAKRKARILRGVPDDGVAVIYRDGELSEYLINVAKRQGLRVFTYGKHPDADIRLIDWSELDNSVELSSPLGPLRFKMSVDGIHMVENAMACIATGIFLGLHVEGMVASFGNFKAIKGRGAEHELECGSGYFTLIDESYNANPLSMGAALRASASRFRRGGYRRHVLILGDMLELGPEELNFHRCLAEPVLQASPDVVILCGPLMRQLRDTLGLTENVTVLAFDTAEEVCDWACRHLAAGDLVMVKSSNGTGLHAVVSTLLENFPAAKRLKGGYPGP